jgi:hypothetical protein
MLIAVLNQIMEKELASVMEVKSSFLIGWKGI